MTIEGKLSRELERTLRGAIADREIPIIVRYVPKRVTLRHRSPLEGVRESYHYRLRPFVHMHATPQAITHLEAERDIVRIYQDLPVRAYLDSSTQRIQAPRVWEEGLLGAGVRIAILDTGIDATHPDVAGRVAATADFSGEGPDDRHGHGTHCASVAAGSGAASAGQYRGVAPAATLYSAKVLGASGEGMMS
ncbi:MAG: S8 family serine peptidase, partial [Chloroflexota bacterium]